MAKKMGKGGFGKSGGGQEGMKSKLLASPMQKTMSAKKGK